MSPLALGMLMELIALFVRCSPLPRATEHVQALYSQYEGLIESILDLEESLKRVSSSLPSLRLPTHVSPSPSRV